MSSQKPPTPTQTAILTNAAERPDRAVLPLTLDTKLTGGARTKVLTALLARTLVEEVTTDVAETAWRKSELGHHLTLRLTDAGMIAAGVEPIPAHAEVQPEPIETTVVPAAPSKSPGGKLGMILAALGANDGASIDALMKLTGWLPHTTRAALTRLRQRGFPITRSVVGGRATYRLAPQGVDADHAA